MSVDPTRPSFDQVMRSHAASRPPGATTRLLWGSTPQEVRASASAYAGGKPALPTGMSGGKVAAIVAGVAVAGGALYMMTRKKEKPPETVGPWTDRVAAERNAQQTELGQAR